MRNLADEIQGTSWLGVIPPPDSPTTRPVFDLVFWPTLRVVLRQRVAVNRLLVGGGLPPPVRDPGPRDGSILDRA